MVRGAAETDELLAAVTEPTRRQLLDLLLERGVSTATGLAESLPISRQAVSKHLAVFTRIGLLEGEKSGREMRYRLNVERLDQATRSLGELAAIWDRRLVLIKQIAESAAGKQSKKSALEREGTKAGEEVVQTLPKTARVPERPKSRSDPQLDLSRGP